MPRQRTGRISKQVTFGCFLCGSLSPLSRGFTTRMRTTMGSCTLFSYAYHTRVRRTWRRCCARERWFDTTLDATCRYYPTARVAWEPMNVRIFRYPRPSPPLPHTTPPHHPAPRQIWRQRGQRTMNAAPPHALLAGRGHDTRRDGLNRQRVATSPEHHATIFSISNYLPPTLRALAPPYAARK